MATDPSKLSGLFKEVYGDDVTNLIPEAAKITKMIPFVPSNKELGNKYHQPVVVSHEHGVTYAAADDGAFTLNDAVAMVTQDAQIQGSQILLRSALSYDAASRASNSKKAFTKATKLLVENMLESATKRLEIAMLYGGKELMYYTTGGSYSSPTSTTAIIPADSGEWATGIWAGMEGAECYIYYLDTTWQLVSSSANAIFTVTTVDVENKKVTFTGTSTGVTALDTAAGSYNLRVVFKGALEKEMYGLQYILENTGTLFNISASTYNLWKGNPITETGQLTMGKVLSAVGTCVQKGLNEDVTVLVNPDTWANLASDLAALRRFDGSYSKKKASNGSEVLEYHGQNGMIAIDSYNMVKDGHCFIFPPKKLKRPGAQDLSFKTPGREDEIFLHLASSAGFEMRLYTDQALLLECPARAAFVSGFTNV